MEVETSYALGKFSAAKQYPYWVAGVSRGEFSFEVSALNYMTRAQLFANSVSGSYDPLGLQLVQCLGKAAHNLVAMDSTGYSYNHGGGRLIGSSVETFNQLAGQLELTNAPDADEIAAASAARRDVFASLQESQDAGDMIGFHLLLRPELQYAANQFTTAAETYGWPAPGASSGNIEPWNS